MATGKKKLGRNSPEYKAVQSNYYHLVLSSEQVHSQFRAKCFERELIGVNDFDDPRQPLFDRARAVIDSILRKIELNQKWYDVLLQVLHEFRELNDIMLQIKESFYDEDSSPNFLSLHRRKHSQTSKRDRSHSDGDVVRFKSHVPSECLDPDSGIVRSLSNAGGDRGSVTQNLPEEEDCDDEQSKVQYLDNSEQNLDVHNTVANSIPVSGANSLTGKAITSDYPKSPLTGDLDAQHYSPPITAEMIDGATSQFLTQSSSSLANKDQMSSENKYLVSENKQKGEEIKKLQKRLGEQSKKIEDQGNIVSEQNDVIKNLKRELDERDGIIRDLKKDRADKEKIIEGMKTNHEQQVEAYKKEIEVLQRKVVELESKEKDARIELERVNCLLAKAELKYTIELGTLREKYREEEKVKLELKIALEKEGKERAQEAARHEAVLRSKSEESEKTAREAAQLAELRLKEMEKSLKELQLGGKK